MDLHLSGKVALVTGASKGIGLAIAEALSAQGARVVAGARGLPDQRPESGDTSLIYQVSVDLSTAEGPQQLVDTAVSVFGGIDILVNNVGAARPRTAGFASVTDDDWNSSLVINFLAAVRTTRAALPHVLANGGAIVTVCSVNALLPDPLVMTTARPKRPC